MWNFSPTSPVGEDLDQHIRSHLMVHLDGVIGEHCATCTLHSTHIIARALACIFATRLRTLGACMCIIILFLFVSF